MVSSPPVVEDFRPDILNDATVLAAVKAEPCGWPLKRGQP